MTIGLICGSDPAVRCGVADYTARLADALERAGVDPILFAGPHNSILSMRRSLNAARAAGCSAVHIQYPAIGFGWSLGPHSAAYFGILPTIVTLHEFSKVHPLRRLSMAAFSGRAAHLIFTTKPEWTAFTRAMKWTEARSSVIPIGSNIPFLAARPPERPIIACFGQIKPARGWENFLELARLARSRCRNYRFLAIGAPVPGRSDYLAGMRAMAADLPVSWLIDAEPVQVAEALATASIAYLPYPDGASGRRGSLLAALGNGLPVVTSGGMQCEPALRAAVETAKEPAEALACIDALLSQPALISALRRAGAEFVAGFRWDAIARRHAEVYEQVFRRASRAGSKLGREVPCR